MINNSELINEIKSYNKFLNHNTLNKAFKFAIDAHKNQKRDEGVPYIIHPVAVAKILTDLKLDSATITTGLLHDTIEDTIISIKETMIRIKVETTIIIKLTRKSLRKRKKENVQTFKMKKQKIHLIC